jgi:CubicO group peptidase (beta-lactamase class C family)
MPLPSQEPLAGALDLVRSPGTTAPPPGVCLAVATPVGQAVAGAGAAALFDDGGLLDSPVPLTTATALDLGSVTKVLATTSALMALVDGGAVRLDDRLGDLLPAAAGTPVAGATLADLLEHRAGLWEWWPLYLTARTPAEALAAAVALPPRYPPGTGRHYSDLGFMLLGAVVAAVARRPLDEAVTQLVIEPYGLSATRYGSPPPGRDVAASSRGDGIEREMVATGRPYPVTGDADAFTGWRTHVLVGEVNDGNAFHAWGGASGHAGLFSTVDDLLTTGRAWLSALAGAGTVGAATAARFFRPGADPGQALGFRRWRSAVEGCEVDAFGHTGFPGVAVGMVPAHDAAVVLATNRLHVDGPPRPTEDMWQEALAAAHRSLHA